MEQGTLFFLTAAAIANLLILYLIINAATKATLRAKYDRALPRSLATRAYMIINRKRCGQKSANSPCDPMPPESASQTNPSHPLMELYPVDVLSKALVVNGDLNRETIIGCRMPQTE